MNGPLTPFPTSAPLEAPDFAALPIKKGWAGLVTKHMNEIFLSGIMPVQAQALRASQALLGPPIAMGTSPG